MSYFCTELYNKSACHSNSPFCPQSSPKYIFFLESWCSLGFSDLLDIKVSQAVDPFPPVNSNQLLADTESHMTSWYRTGFAIVTSNNRKLRPSTSNQVDHCNEKVLPELQAHRKQRGWEMLCLRKRQEREGEREWEGRGVRMRVRIADDCFLLLVKGNSAHSWGTAQWMLGSSVSPTGKSPHLLFREG